MSAVFVYAGDRVLHFDDDAAALDAACTLADEHARVGIGAVEETATRVRACALPGMVVCARDDTPANARCYPLTRTVALVSRSRSRVDVVA
jgi:hypothetical protein